MAAPKNPSHEKMKKMIPEIVLHDDDSRSIVTLPAVPQDVRSIARHAPLKRSKQSISSTKSESGRRPKDHRKSSRREISFVSKSGDIRSATMLSSSSDDDDMDQQICGIHSITVSELGAAQARAEKPTKRGPSFSPKKAVSAYDYSDSEDQYDLRAETISAFLKVEQERLQIKHAKSYTHGNIHNLKEDDHFGWVARFSKFLIMLQPKATVVCVHISSLFDAYLADLGDPRSIINICAPYRPLHSSDI